MTCHIARPAAWLLLAAVPASLAWAGAAVAQVQPPLPARAPAIAPAAAQPAAAPAISADEAALRAADEAYVAAYNKGDAKALAALFTEDAEVVEADGDRSEGRAAIEESYTEVFKAEKGVKLNVDVESIRFLSPDVAREEGLAVLTPTQGSPVSTHYIALLVKKDGKWLISSVRDEPAASSPHDRLRALEWMVGDWVDEGSESTVRLRCHWSEDGNYLIRDFIVHRAGKPIMTVTQRIGWDPLARQFRSWEFDSEGGYGQGRWSRAGENWVVKHTGTRPEGETASSTNIMTRVRPDLVRWVSSDRVIGDEAVTEDESFVLVRVPPAPRITPARAETAPTPNTRSPR